MSDTPPPKAPRFSLSRLPAPEVPQFIRPAEAARLLNMNIRTVKSHIADGIIPSEMVGGCCVIPVAYLRHLEASALGGAA